MGFFSSILTIATEVRTFAETELKKLEQARLIVERGQQADHPSCRHCGFQHRSVPALRVAKNTGLCVSCGKLLKPRGASDTPKDLPVTPTGVVAGSDPQGGKIRGSDVEQADHPSCCRCGFRTEPGYPIAKSTGLCVFCAAAQFAASDTAKDLPVTPPPTHGTPPSGGATGATAPGVTGAMGATCATGALGVTGATGATSAAAPFETLPSTRPLAAKPGLETLAQRPPHMSKEAAEAMIGNGPPLPPPAVPFAAPIWHEALIDAFNTPTARRADVQLRSGKIASLSEARRQIANVLADEHGERKLVDLLQGIDALLATIVASSAQEGVLTADGSLALILTSASYEVRGFLAWGLRVPEGYRGPVKLSFLDDTDGPRVYSPDDPTLDLQSQVSDGLEFRFFAKPILVTNDTHIAITPASARLFGALVMPE